MFGRSLNCLILGVCQAFFQYILKMHSEREIFARRAMVDQAQECLRYQRKILNILEILNIEKLTRSVFWLFLIVN